VGAEPIGGNEPPRRTRVWARPLADGSIAVALFNIGEREVEVSCPLRALGLSGDAAARNLWERRDLGCLGSPLAIAVPAHGAQLLRLAPS
jgi:alpha-galactosidase